MQWKILINGGFDGNIIYNFFHCHVCRRVQWPSCGIPHLSTNLSTAITALRNYCDVCGNLGAVCDITPSQAESVFHRNDEYSMAIHDIAICGLICILCINVLMYIYIYVYIHMCIYIYTHESHEHIWLYAKILLIYDAYSIRWPFGS